MNFQDLHELLRVELLRRIERGTLTGSRLAQQAGFQQAHISNFLNRKRALSLEGLDRVMASQNLTVEQILPLELTAVAAKVPGDTVELVPVVSASVAMDDARIPSGKRFPLKADDTVKFGKTVLQVKVIAKRRTAVQK